MKLSWLIMVLSATTDIITTLYNIHCYGIEIEGNPLLKYVMECTNPLAGILLLKIVGIVGITYVVSLIGEYYEICGRLVKSEWFYYFPSIVWFYGTLSHIVLIFIN